MGWLRGRLCFFAGLLAVVVLLGINLNAQAPSGPSLLKAAKLKNQYVENLFQVTDKVFSGGSPEGEEAFEVLAKLGVKTVLNVDGGAGNVDLAARYGIRYVHLPIGYSGISPERQKEFAKLAKTADGPIFVHCHHGKHRGPAAAAVVCTMLDDWGKEERRVWLELAGTSPKYRGLYRDLAEFTPPSDEELAQVSAEFPERAEVPSMTSTMCEIDALWEELQRAAANKRGAPAKLNRDEIRTAALLLQEQFHEMNRQEHGYGEDFAALTAEAERASAELEKAAPLESERQADRLEKRLKAIENSCQTCHAKYRDNVDIPK